MAHGENVNSIEVEAPKLFDRMARRFNVDYAFYKTGPDKYLLFFKAGQADAITACFERYSRRLLEQSKSSRIPIREQLKKAAEQLVKEPPKTQERTKEVVREERYCADCGGKMYVHRTNNGKRISQYTCSQYSKVPVGKLCTTQHRINEDVVLSLVSEMLKAIGFFC